MTLVMCVKKASLPVSWSINGFHPCSSDEVLTGIGHDVWFAPRAQVELDEGFIQIIPYVIIDINKIIATYNRSSTLSEDRLNGKLSIGFGGHIEIQDVALSEERVVVMQTIWNATERELHEEIGCAQIEGASIAGVLWDGSSKVGQVHLGILIYLARPHLEIGNTTVRWVAKNQLRDNRDKMEPWSKSALEWLEAQG